jgi:integrase
MAGIRRVRQPVLSIEEEQPLLAAAAPHLKPLILAALDTGMRRGELFTQRAEDIDMPRKVLSVTHSKTIGGEQREIPLTARMVSLLEDMPKSGLVFTYRGGELNKLRWSWMTAVKNAGIRPLLFRHLRHTFNTRLMEAGVIQDVRMSLMGHSQGRPRTTNDIYTHIELPMLRHAIQKLEAWTVEQQQEIAERKEREQQHEEQ